MPVDIRGLSHIVLPVSNLDEALAFYRDALGLKVVMQLNPDDPDAGGGMLSGVRIAGVLLPGGTILELGEGISKKTESSSVIALNVPDIAAAQREIEAAGLTPSMPPTEVIPGITMMFVQDPDGRTIEFVEFASGATTSYENLPADAAR